MLALLAFTTPGVADTVYDLVAHIAGVECCDDGCGEQGGCSPQSCTHCVCCAHSRALLGAPGLISIPLVSTESGHAGFARARYRLPSGYRAPPFRPPVV
jgi:hypothetical protein